jgi:ABC-type branched-subunit amino acid transport system ATPase component
MIEVQPDLEVDGLTVQFGGLVAVNGVSLAAAAGSITGLIGPNGAGKTTIFNACTGVVPCSAGSVLLGGRDLGRLSTASRASHGLGRTFQRMELFDSMTVAENVALGPEAFLTARRPWSQLASPRHQRRAIAGRTKEAMDRCGIGPMTRQRVGDLSTGQRRLVELARAMATPFHFLLLDEPSSGLDVVETERFGQIISRFVAETGIGILLVEHDMALVSAVCAYIHVLDFGNLIFQGPCAEVLSSATVRAAYLGSDEISVDAKGGRVPSHA